MHLFKLHTISVAKLLFWKLLTSVQILGLKSFRPVLHFILKPVIWYAQQIKWLVSIWNATRNWYVLITTLLETELLLYFCAKFHVYRTFLTDIWEELMLCQNLTSKSPSKAWLTLFKMASFGVTYRCRKGLKVPST